MLLFVFIAAATGLLIYNGVTREKYVKEDDTMVEEFKEWNRNSKQKNKAADAIIGSRLADRWSASTGRELMTVRVAP
jgi:hypothetical protein